MNKYNGILGQMVGLVGRSGFEKQVKIHRNRVWHKRITEPDTIYQYAVRSGIRPAWIEKY